MVASRPDPAPEPTLWRAAGRLLPAELRRRVFEPAYFDLLAACRCRKRHTFLGLQVVLLVLETYRVGVPGLLQNLWRAPRRVRLALVVAAFSLAYVVFVLSAYD